MTWESSDTYYVDRAWMIYTPSLATFGFNSRWWTVNFLILLLLFIFFLLRKAAWPRWPFSLHIRDHLSLNLSLGLGVGEGGRFQRRERAWVNISYARGLFAFVHMQNNNKRGPSENENPPSFHSIENSLPIYIGGIFCLFAREWRWRWWWWALLKERKEKERKERKEKRRAIASVRSVHTKTPYRIDRKTLTYCITSRITHHIIPRKESQKKKIGHLF